MRIVVIGQAAFGEKVTEALLKQGELVVGIYTAPDVAGRANPLKELALRLGIPVLQPQRMRAPEVYAAYVKLQPELNVMAFVTDILPESILSYPQLGTIQYHPSLLPRHRGGSAINWAIIQGDTRTGITIFWPDKGIDTGPILMQKEVGIAPDDTVGSLYFNKLFPLGVAALVESVALVKRGTAPRIPQDESQATYEPLCTGRHAVIDWSQPVQRVYNLVRGTNPQPGAIAYFRGRRFKVFDSNLAISGAGRAPGTIVDIIKDGFVVAAPGGGILVRRVQPDGAAKMASADFARQVGFSVGDRLV